MQLSSAVPRVRPRPLRWPASIAAAAALAVAIGSPAAAGAPGVDPAVVDTSTAPGTSLQVAKTVSTSPIPPNPDVVLLVDTTASMGDAIANVQMNLHQVITEVRAAQPSAQFAVASYRDESDGAQLFQVRQDITANEPAVQAAVDTLAADGGGDVPEAWVNGLYQVATGSINFRAGSSRIVVLVGDSSSHDPSAGHSLADAETALSAAGARIVAVDVDSGLGDGLDATGEITNLLNTIGGEFVASAPDQVTAAILAGLHDLDVTVSPVVTACDPHLAVSFDRGEVTQQSGTDFHYMETIDVAGDAPAGSVLHCTVEFHLNGAAAGPSYTEQITVHVTDVVPPVVVVDDKTVEATSAAGAVINYPATAVDNVDGPLTPTCVPPSGTLFPLGATLVTCTATDAAGNVGKDTATMRVVDTTPPVPACTPTTNPAGHVPPARNPDGFYLLSGTDLVDSAVDLYIRDTASPSVQFGPYPSGTRIKLVQAPGSTPNVKPGTGDVDYKVTLRGDALIVAVDDAHNSSAGVTCLVPPGPK